MKLIAVQRGTASVPNISQTTKKKRKTGINMAKVCGGVPCSSSHSALITKRLSSAPKNSKRRLVFSLLSISFALSSATNVNAKDIPIFGIKPARKQQQQQQESSSARNNNSETVAMKKDGQQSNEYAAAPLAPAVQAGVVGGAELLGILIASSVVNKIVASDSS